MFQNVICACVQESGFQSSPPNACGTPSMQVTYLSRIAGELHRNCISQSHVDIVLAIPTKRAALSLYSTYHSLKSIAIIENALHINLRGKERLAKMKLCHSSAFFLNALLGGKLAASSSTPFV